jgi:hypothetical protein
MQNQALPQALLFLGFAAVSFVMLRAIVNHLARRDHAAFAAPLMIVLGTVSGLVFLRLGLQNFFIWHVIIFALIMMSWHAKSRVDDKKLIEMARRGAAPAGKSDADVIQSYTMTRRLLSFGFVSYLAAFSATTTSSAAAELPHTTHGRPPPRRSAARGARLVREPRAGASRDRSRTGYGRRRRRHQAIDRDPDRCGAASDTGASLGLARRRQTRGCT